MINLKKELKEKERLGGNKLKLEKDEADKLETQKARNHDKLKNKKKRRILESPSQFSLPNSPDCTLEEKNP